MSNVPISQLHPDIQRAIVQRQSVTTISPQLSSIPNAQRVEVEKMRPLPDRKQFDRSVSNILFPFYQGAQKVITNREELLQYAKNLGLDLYKDSKDLIKKLADNKVEIAPELYPEIGKSTKVETKYNEIPLEAFRSPQDKIQKPEIVISAGPIPQRDVYTSLLYEKSPKKEVMGIKVPTDWRAGPEILLKHTNNLIDNFRVKAEAKVPITREVAKINQELMMQQELEKRRDEYEMNRRISPILEFANTINTRQYISQADIDQDMKSLDNMLKEFDTWQEEYVKRRNVERNEKFDAIIDKHTKEIESSKSRVSRRLAEGTQRLIPEFKQSDAERNIVEAAERMKDAGYTDAQIMNELNKVGGIVQRQKLELQKAGFLEPFRTAPVDVLKNMALIGAFAIGVGALTAKVPVIAPAIKTVAVPVIAYHGLKIVGTRDPVERGRLQFELGSKVVAAAVGAKIGHSLVHSSAPQAHAHLAKESQRPINIQTKTSGVDSRAVKIKQVFSEASDRSADITKIIKAKGLKSTRLYEFSMKNPATGKVLKYEFVEWAHKDVVGLRTDSSRIILGVAKDGSGKIVQKFLAMASDKTNPKTLITRITGDSVAMIRQEEVGGGFVKRAYRKIFGPREYYEIHPGQFTEKVIPTKSSISATGKKMPVHRLLYDDKSKMLTSNAKSVDQPRIETVEKHITHFLKAEPFKVTGKQAEFMMQQLLQQKSSWIAKSARFPSGKLKIHSIDWTHAGSKSTAKVNWSYIKANGEIQPTVYSARVTVPKKLFVTGYIKSSGHSVLQRMATEMSLNERGIIQTNDKIAVTKAVKKFNSNSPDKIKSEIVYETADRIQYKITNLNTKQERTLNVFKNANSNVVEDQAYKKLVSDFGGTGQYERSTMTVSSMPADRGMTRFLSNGGQLQPPAGGAIEAMVKSAMPTLLSSPQSSMMAGFLSGSALTTRLTNNQLRNIMQTNNLTNAQLNLLVNAQLITPTQAQNLSTQQVQQQVQRQIQQPASPTPRIGVSPRPSTPTRLVPLLPMLSRKESKTKDDKDKDKREREYRLRPTVIQLLHKIPLKRTKPHSKLIGFELVR